MSIDELTEKELLDLKEKNPQLLDSLKKGDPIGKAWISSYKRNKNLTEEAIEHARSIKNAIEKSPHEQGSLLSWCGYPTDMTRCSPFFPINKKNLGKREDLKNFIITSTSWGKITYTGPKLSTYEEDALIVVLAALNNIHQYRKTTETNGYKTYTYKGPALPLLRLLSGTKRTPSKKDYIRLISSLKLLVSAIVTLSLSSGKTKTGKKKEPREIDITNMLTHVRWNEEKKELSVTVNPFFYESYLAKTVTSLDVKIRSELKSPVTKALYRFVQSHSKHTVFKGHFLTLAEVLNMDRCQPSFEIRRTLKRAISELTSKSVLTKKSEFIDKDIVLLEKTFLLKEKNYQKNYT